MNKMKILVTYAGVWKMDNGQSGMTLNYFMYGENGEQMISRVDATGGPVGQQRAKCSLDPSMRQKISFVPGIYDATMGMKIGSDGKPAVNHHIRRYRAYQRQRERRVIFYGIRGFLFENFFKNHFVEKDGDHRDDSRRDKRKRTVI